MTTPIFNDAVQITAADFCPGENYWEQFDDNPFSEYPDWLQEAMTANYVAIDYHRSRERDYAVWQIRVTDGSTVAGEPGDLIARASDGNLWLIKEMARKPVEKAVAGYSVG